MPKSEHAFRTISEAAEEVGVPQHVLRFWETKFAFIQPLKRAGGRRFYRPQDIAILQAVKALLHDKGLTIRGVQRLHKDGGLKQLLGAEVPQPMGMDAAAGAENLPRSHPTSGLSSVRLQRVLAELEAARSTLDAVLAR